MDGAQVYSTEAVQVGAHVVITGVAVTKHGEPSKAAIEATEVEVVQ